MIPGIDPKVDYAFKVLFGRDESRPLLIDLLNAVLRRCEGERVESVELLNPFSPKAAIADKLSIVDVRARDEKGRLFNIEMQAAREPAYPNRIVYYGTRSHSQQLGEGDGYHLLRPTISICFLDHELFEGPAWHSRFVLLETTRHEPLSDDLEFHFFELPKFVKTADEVSDALERWLYFLRHAEMMDTEAVPAQLRTPPILRALKELEMVSQDEIARVRYEEQLDSKRTYEFNLRMSRQEGEKIGRQKGEQIGQQKGEKIGSIRTMELFLGKPQTSVDDLTRLSPEELDRLAADLERQFRDAPR